MAQSFGLEAGQNSSWIKGKKQEIKKKRQKWRIY
jgi:hypothetical protein